MLWFKHPDAVRPNLLLLSYLALAYPLAWYGLSSPAGFAPSLLLMVNVLVLSAYLLHDCLHNNIFASPAGNEKLGTALAWLVGAVYSPYSTLRDKHFRHHIERADILAVNYGAVLIKHPLLDRSVKWATWLYLPAVECLLRGLELFAPFYLSQRRHLQSRNLLLFTIRSSLFCAVCYISPLAAMGYVIAYLLFLSILGFMDAFQHSYDIHYRLLAAPQKPARDRHYEEGNTYSNLLSSRWHLINLLVLNFCYHNVHHQKPNEPWHRLPALHDKSYPNGCMQLIPLATQVAHFRRHRIERIHHASANPLAGADGVSFLVGI